MRAFNRRQLLILLVGFKNQQSKIFIITIHLKTTSVLIKIINIKMQIVCHSEIHLLFSCFSSFKIKKKLTRKITFFFYLFNFFVVVCYLFQYFKYRITCVQEKKVKEIVREREREKSKKKEMQRLHLYNSYK